MTAVLPHIADIRQALPSHAPPVASALAVAFTDDPVFRWMLPDDDVGPVATRTFFDVVVDILAPRDDASTTAGGATGAALWVPAGARRCPISGPSSSPT